MKWWWVCGAEGPQYRLDADALGVFRSVGLLQHLLSTSQRRKDRPHSARVRPRGNEVYHSRFARRERVGGRGQFEAVLALALGRARQPLAV